MTSRAGMLGMGEVGMTVGRVRGEGGGKSKTCNSSKPCRVLGEMEAKREER